MTCTRATYFADLELTKYQKMTYDCYENVKIKL